MHARHALGNAAQYFVGHGSTKAGDFGGVDATGSAAADQYHVVALLDSRNPGDIDQSQIHRDVADNRRVAAANDHATFVREAAAVAVFISSVEHRVTGGRGEGEGVVSAWLLSFA